MEDKKENNKPECFGILDEVFPLSDSGIREVRERCIDCPLRVDCLRKALETEDGIRMREELLERMPVRGMGDWLRRWSDKKTLYRMAQAQKEEGYFLSLWKELKQVIFSPILFFSKDKQINIKNAFTFGIMTGSIGSMFSFFWKFLLLEEKFPAVINILKNTGYFGSVDAIIFLSFLLTPIVVSLEILIYSILLHFFLVLFGAGKRGLKATFFVICYSQAPEIFSIFPMLGSIIASVWKIYIQILGLKHVHETSYIRVILSFVGPVFVLLFIMITVASIFYYIIPRSL